MINKERLLSLFTRLVAIDSPSRGERRMCDAIQEILAGMDIETREDDAGEKIGGSAGNLYAYFDGDLDLPPILFSAHMDTVEPSSGKQAVIHEDGTITSAGNTVLGADDLSGVVSILEAIYTIKENGLPHRPIELSFDVSEETYCTGARYLDYSRIRSKEAYILDLSGNIGHASNQAPTILSFVLVFKGKAAHAAFAPEEGSHAVKAAAESISYIECGHVGETTVNIGTIHGGTADNIIPDFCSVTGEIRSFSDSAAMNMLSKIENICRQHTEGKGVSLNLSYEKPLTAYHISEDRPVAERFKKVCAALNIQPVFRDTFGGSDNHHFVFNGLDGLVIASGMNACHSSDEYTTVNDLVRAAEITLSLMISED